MAKLFIIGNGFDCYAHRMRTKYSDFRDFIIKKYPDIVYSNYVPESQLMPDGEVEYDDDEVAGFIVQILGVCMDSNWSTLENLLGMQNLYDEFAWHFQIVDMEADDNDISHAIKSNEDYGKDIGESFVKLRDLFNEWVWQELGGIDYRKVCRSENIHRIILQGDYFLNFNYTHTLEEVYAVPFEKVCHIHGDINSEAKSIYFGHGSESEIEESEELWGAEDALNQLKRGLRKDTNQALMKKQKFFDNLNDVTEIYSYGFSFSDVDMIYMAEICRHIQPENVTWYFNTFDWENNKQYIQKIDCLGFKTKCKSEW